MRQVTYQYILDAKIIHINNRSVTLKTSKDETILCTSKVYNQLLANPETDIIFIVEKEKNFKKNLWVAIPSIFG